MTKYNMTSMLIIAAFLGSSACSFAKETPTEKLETASNKTVDAVKRTYRNAKDEICEMVDGKANCVVKKVINKIKGTSDDIDTTATEAKNKAD